MRLMVKSQDLLSEEAELKSPDSSAEQVKAILLCNKLSHFVHLNNFIMLFPPHFVLAFAHCGHVV